jgi:hypothetical protein
MKKISIVSFASFVFLFLCSAVAVLMKNVFDSAISALAVGVVILIVSGVIAFVVRERMIINMICFLLSSVAMGILIRAWYINRGFENSFGTVCMVSLATVLYLWVFFALSKIPFIHKSKAAYTVLCALYAVLSIVFYFVVMLNTETTFVSTFGFYMIIELAFIFAMSLEVNTKEELVRNLTLSTYSVFIVAIIAAVVIIAAAAGGDCDCDCGADGCCDDGCADCCDCGGGSGETSRKKANKKKRYRMTPHD